MCQAVGVFLLNYTVLILATGQHHGANSSKLYSSFRFVTFERWPFKYMSYVTSAWE